MPNTLRNATPLRYGELAPNFELEAVTGSRDQRVTRHQFRNKSALVLAFFPLGADAQTWLHSLDRDRAEYQELNAHVLGIVSMPPAQIQAWGATSNPPLSPLIQLLSDPDCRTWRAYTGSEQPRYALVVLDIYGGVDAQQVGASFAEMPDAATILEWTRAAQFRCNI